MLKLLLSNRFALIRCHLPLSGVLVIPFVCQMIVAVGLVGYLSYRSGSRAVTVLTYQLQLQVSESIHHHLDDYLQGQQQAIAVSHQGIQDNLLDPNNPEQLRQFFWQQMVGFPKLPALRFTSSQGNEVGYGRLLSQETLDQVEDLIGERLAPGTFYFHAAQANTPGRDYYLVDKRGEPTRKALSIPIDLRETTWYQELAAAPGQIWSDVFVSYTVPSLMINAGRPVYDSQQNLIGVLSTTATLSDIGAFLQQVDFSPRGQVYILDGSGNVIATSTALQPFRTDAQGKPTPLAAVDSDDPWLRAIASQLQFDSGSLVDETGPVDFQLKVAQEKLFVRVDNYRDEYGLDWSVAIAIPESDFMATINANRRQTWLLSGAILTIAIALGALTARWLSQPITTLNSASQSLKVGRWPEIKSFKGIPQELTTLMTSFQQMVEALQHSQSEVQQTLLQLDHQNYQLEQFLEAFPLGILVLDPQLKVQYINQRAIAMTGKDFMAADIPDFEAFCQIFRAYRRGTEESYPEEKCPIVRALAGETSQVDDLELHREDGAIPLEMLGTPIYSLDTTIAYAMVIFQDISERLQSISTLEESEARYRTIVETANEGIWIMDQGAKTTYANETMATILGTTPALMLGQSVLDFCPEHIRAAATATIHERQQGLQGNGEIQLQRQDGSLIWVLYGATPLFDKQGNYNGALAMVTDISDRKQAELDLQRSQRFLQKIADASPTILYIYDLQEQRNIYVNREIGTILGYSPTEIQAMGNSFFAQLMHPDDFEKVPAEYERLAAAKDDVIYEYEYRMRNKQGEWRWLYSRYSVFSRDAAGRVKQTIGSAQDITQRKFMEVQLRESRAQYQRLVDDIGNQFVIFSHTGPEGVLTYVSGGMMSIFGRTAESTLHKPWAEVINWLPEDMEKGVHSVQQLLDRETAADQFEMRFIHPNGTLRTVNVAHHSVYDEQGKLIAIEGILEDISDRKAAEAQLERTNAELLRATQLKDEFLAMMSHELRTPLNAILGTTEILQEEIYGPITPKQDQALTTIDQSGTHLLELINEILELATIEAGQCELELGATAIAYLCESSLVFLKSQAQKKRIKLTLECPPDLPQFYLDERRIRRALINLLSNAVKFTPSGGQVKLIVTYPVPDDSGHEPLPYLRLQVEDNGIGIDPKNFPTLFDPFIQVDRALNRQHEGTGLGLALVKQIVELHGGQVSVTSRVGLGSCFTVDLPGNCVPEIEPEETGLDYV